jgi:phage terminase large subunit
VGDLAEALTIRVKRGETEALLYRPTPKQVQFQLCAAKRVLYGGAAGGGKSHAMRWDAYLRCLAVPGYRALILRRTFPELEKTHIDRASLEAPLMGAKPKTSDREVEFGNGAKVVFGHCQDDEAIGKHLSTEWDAIYFDELVTFTQRQFLMIASRARTSKPGVSPVVRAGTNPGGPGAHWVREWFIDKTVDLKQFPAYKPENYAYIPATLDDNPHIDPEYEQSLLDLPEALRRAYRYGDWDIFEGQYFSEWRKANHVGFVPIPEGVQWVRAVDWGYVKPGWCGWFACLPEGRVILAWEYLFSQTIAAEVAKEIKRRTQALGAKVRYTVGDTAMWTPEGQTGETIAETFAKHGVPMVQADKDRVNGWQRVRHWLREAPDGKPWLMVTPDCPYAIRTFPAAVMDTHKPEDVDSDGEDHALDAIRYFCMSRPSPTRAEGRKVYRPGSLGWHQSRDRRELRAYA